MKDRVIAVTGAASGIGAALCSRLAVRGARLVMHTGSNREALSGRVQTLLNDGVQVEAVIGDLTEPDESARLVNAALERFGQLDGVVSNAGFPDLTPFEVLDDERMRRSFEAMPAAFLRIMREAAPALRHSSCGRVVAVSSFVAHRFLMGGDNFTASAAAKGALEGLVRSLAERLAPDGITVNAVAPGYIKKDQEASLTIEAASASRRGISEVAMGRIGTPDEVAAVIEFLLCGDAAYVTGQTIHVDGGLTL